MTLTFGILHIPVTNSLLLLFLHILLIMQIITNKHIFYEFKLKYNGQLEICHNAEVNLVATFQFTLTLSFQQLFQALFFFKNR